MSHMYIAVLHTSWQANEKVLLWNTSEMVALLNLLYFWFFTACEMYFLVSMMMKSYPRSTTADKGVSKLGALRYAFYESA